MDVIRNQCSNAIFEFGASSTNSRKYDIKILQFTCDDEMGNNTNKFFGNQHYITLPVQIYLNQKPRIRQLKINF